MTKKDILNLLEKYDLNKKEFIILSGASLVLQDVKEETRDIDITVSEYLYNKLLNDYNCIFEKEVNNYLVWFIDDIINFSIHYYDEIEYIDYKYNARKELNPRIFLSFLIISSKYSLIYAGLSNFSTL